MFCNTRYCIVPLRIGNVSIKCDHETECMVPVQCSVSSINWSDYLCIIIIYITRKKVAKPPLSLSPTIFLVHLKSVFMMVTYHLFLVVSLVKKNQVLVLRFNWRLWEINIVLLIRGNTITSLITLVHDLKY